jgi:glycosyltransferase involved in cell wall biosynthesis
MKILMIADPLIPVPPVMYGGVERMIDMLSRCLVQQGHEVHLMAGKGSRDYGGGLSLYERPGAGFASRAYRKLAFQALSTKCAWDADLVINHGRLDYLESIYRMRVPLVCWFHNPLTGTEVPFVKGRRQKRVRWVAVSQSHASYAPDARDYDVVLNSVDTDAIPFSDGPKDEGYFLFLGRMTRNKGLHLAIQAARRAGVKLVIGGNVTKEPGQAEYFEQEIKPHLGDRCEWVGPYDDAMKAKLVSGARALLFPINWPEPCALVVLESLAAGTPVIATRCASTPEIVDHGRTGFLCDNVDDIVASMARIDTIDRRVCREDAVRRFSIPAYGERVKVLLDHIAADSPAKVGWTARA